MKIFEKFINTIRSYQMLHKADCVIVAVSGGPDSVALFQLLKSIQNEYQLKLVIAHLNHRLRGKDSDADEAFVRQLAEHHAVPCVVDTISPEGLLRLRHESLEAGLRNQRYAFLKRCAAMHAAQKIALGHTMNDQAETLLMRLIRGGGTLGLASIFPVRQDGIIRPMLFIRREDIVGYLQEEKLIWREDYSNHDLRFFRNRVRHELIPLMLKYNPQLMKQLSRTAEILRDEETLLTDCAVITYTQLASHREGRVFLNVESLGKLPRGLQRILLRYVILKDEEKPTPIKMFTFRDYASLLDLLKPGKSGRKVRVGGVVVRRDFGNLIFEPTSRVSIRPRYDIHLPVPGEAKVVHTNSVFLARLEITQIPERVLNRWELLLTGEELKVGLQIRNWRPGDRYHPQGRASSKKLKELFAQRKVSRELRPLWPIITLMGQIVFAKDFPVSVDMINRQGMDSYQTVIIEECRGES